jgi:uncharacterized protein YfcZ (UPF0381/DUF406 family)
VDKKKNDRDLRKVGQKWLERIKASELLEKQWLDDAKNAENVFACETNGTGNDASGKGKYDFNILYANVETIVPAVINSQPVPDIRRRFADQDPAARIVAELLERAIRVQIDDSRLQTELEAMAQDAFLGGRGVIRVRFHSDIVEDSPSEDDIEDAAEGEGEDDKPDPAEVPYGEGVPEDDGAEDGPDAAASNVMGHNGGPPLERLENERLSFEAVPWIDYRHGPAKRWEHRKWDAFRFVIPREDEEKSFDAESIASQLSENETATRKQSEDDLCGWEIWCKEKREVLFVDDSGVVLKVVDDPLGLSDFFCIATPVQPISINGRLKPVNPFSVYRTLAEDLEKAIRRKARLVNALKARGWYAGLSDADLSAVIGLEDNEFAPIPNPELLMQAGGIDKAIAFWPLEKFVVAIQQVDAAISQYKQWIYEITGISDIVRGASMASETATAQNIKSQWGSLRIQKMQRLIERCARDLFVMMSELIPSKFSLKTLEGMTGMQLMPTPQDLMSVPPPQPTGNQEADQAAMMKAQQAEQARQKKLQDMQAVLDLLDKRLSTFYRIDVESDSTVRADLTRQKQEVAQFLQGAGQYFQAVGPLVQQGVLPADAALEIFIANARLFNLGRSVEDTLENMVTQAKEKAKQAEGQPQQQQPNPEQMAKAAKLKAEADAKAQDTQIKRQQFTMDMQRQQMELKTDMEKAMAEYQAKGAEAQRDAILGVLEQKLKSIELAIKEVELSSKQAELASNAFSQAIGVGVM